MGACPWRFESSLRHQLLIPEDPRQRATGGLALGATCFAGLGPLLRSELHRIGASGISVSRIRNHDYVSFRLDSANLRSLRSLRLAEDLFLEIAVAKRIEKPSDIRSLSSRLNKQVTLEAISLKNLLYSGQTGQETQAPVLCLLCQAAPRSSGQSTKSLGTHGAFDSKCIPTMAFERPRRPGVLGVLVGLRNALPAP